MSKEKQIDAFRKTIEKFEKYYLRESGNLFQGLVRISGKNAVSDTLKKNFLIESEFDETLEENRNAKPLTFGLYYGIMTSDFESRVCTINEGLLKSYPIDKLHAGFKKACAKILPKKLLETPTNDFVTLSNGISKKDGEKLIDRISVGNVYGDEKESSTVTFFMPFDKNVDLEKAFKFFTDELYLFGWDYSFHKTIQGKDPNVSAAKITFEKRYSNALSKFVGKKVFHFCPKRVAKKILKDGLVPKSKSNVYKYQDRVYLFAIDNLRQAQEAYRFLTKKRLSGDAAIDEDFAMVIIDFEKLLQSKQFKEGKLNFYQDPMFGDGDKNNPAIFTYNTISRDFLDKDFVLDLGNGNAADDEKTYGEYLKQLNVS